MVEAQGCPGLVAKTGERWPMGQSPWNYNRWGPGPNEASILGKGLGGKAPGVKQYWFGVDAGDITWGCPEGGLVPESNLSPWVAKPFGGRQDPPEAVMS
jgi:hypothetical protein